MLVLPTSQTHLKLHHIALTQPLRCPVDATGIVRFTNIRAKLHFLKRWARCLLLPFFLLILMLTIIHYFGNGRIFPLGNYNKVEIRLLRNLKRFTSVSQASVVVFMIDQKNVIGANLSIYGLLLSDNTYLLGLF